MAGLSSLQRDPEWLLSEDGTEKPKLLWRFQDARDTRIIKCVLRKATDVECSQLKREAVCAQVTKLKGEQSDSRLLESR